MQLLCTGGLRLWRLLQAMQCAGAHSQALHGSHQMYTDCMYSLSVCALATFEDSNSQMRCQAVNGKAKLQDTSPRDAVP